MNKLEKITKVDLREAWPNEQYDFTPWLEKEENLNQLGNVLGIDLIFQNREVEVGTYKADIVCKDGYSDDNILIENQLEKTDHKHLGQISTYAAGIKAKTVIWIAEKFTDEHRAAIDWQNSITVDGYNYFGIEVEILKIGNSPLAPNFKIVCKPNNWSKKYSNVSNKSDTKLFYFDYWTKLKEKCDNENSVLKVQSPRYSHWCTIAVGKSGYSLCGTFSSQQKKLSASLYINNDKDGFLELERQKTDIENEIGCKLSWELLPDKQASRIALYKNDIDVNDDNLEKALSWQKTSLEKLHSAFSKRLKKLHSNLDSEAA
tara:strand:+ start:3444 stop:4394 length:951 start_codon:yes stop_codon:yes gene_type:complete